MTHDALQIAIVDDMGRIFLASLANRVER